MTQILNLKSTHKPVKLYYQQLKQLQQEGYQHEGAVRKTFDALEVVTFLNSRNLHYKAVEIGDRLITDLDFELVEVDQILLREGAGFQKLP